VNTNVLAKLYDRLTPQERLPLIFAASIRGDDVERDRLARSAPRNCFRIPDYHGLAEGVLLAAMFHRMEQLDLAALFWRNSAALADERDFRGKEGNAREARLNGTLRLFAYLFVVNAEGWKRYCSEARLDADRLLSDLPGAGTLDLTEKLARDTAFSRAEASAWIRRKCHDQAEAPTDDEMADAIRALVN
jgi:hypothetical protein